MVGGGDSDEEVDALDADGAERVLVSRRVRRGRGGYWLAILRSRQRGQVGSEYYMMGVKGPFAQRGERQRGAKRVTVIHAGSRGRPLWMHPGCLELR